MIKYNYLVTFLVKKRDLQGLNTQTKREFMIGPKELNKETLKFWENKMIHEQGWTKAYCIGVCRLEEASNDKSE